MWITSFCASLCVVGVAAVRTSDHAENGNSTSILAVPPLPFQSEMRKRASECLSQSVPESQFILNTADGLSNKMLGDHLVDALKKMRNATGKKNRTEKVRIVGIWDARVPTRAKDDDAKSVATLAEIQEFFIVDNEKARLNRWLKQPAEWYDILLHEDAFSESAAITAVEGADIFYLAGGSAYFLMAAFERRKSFWEQTVLPKIRGGQLIHVSESAGSIASGTHIGIARGSRGAGYWWDRTGKEEGLGLVPGILRPHYNKDLEPALKEYAEEVGAKVVPFANGEAVEWAGHGRIVGRANDKIDEGKEAAFFAQWAIGHGMKDAKKHYDTLLQNMFA
mmetsp:Transcript_35763/g.64862  ORF Transcript_35763/g.64862 Transcript_35763/m.64862 type:complete len:336 (+) Transcript_35763:56-1063(+)